MKAPPKPINPAAANAARSQYRRFLEVGGTPGGTCYGITAIEATGRASCRVCGEKPDKGEPVLKFRYDFGGVYGQEVQIHARQCERKEEAA